MKVLLLACQISQPALMIVILVLGVSNYRTAKALFKLTDKTAELQNSVNEMVEGRLSMLETELFR